MRSYHSAYKRVHCLFVFFFFKYLLSLVFLSYGNDAIVYLLLTLAPPLQLISSAMDHCVNISSSSSSSCRNKAAEDPPTLQTQIELPVDSANQLSLDMDIDMPELRLLSPPSPAVAAALFPPSQASGLTSPRVAVAANDANPNLRLRLQTPPSSPSSSFSSSARDPLLGNANIVPPSLINGDSSSSSDSEEAVDQQRGCLRNNTMQKRSRLADICHVQLPQAQINNRRSSSNSPQIRSAMLSKTGFLGKVDEKKEEEEEEAEEEEDPLEGDFPESFRKPVCGVWNVLEWVAFVMIIGALPSSLVVPQLKHRALVGMPLWKWVLVVFLLLSGRLLSRWLVGIVVLLLERSFVMRKKVLYFVYALRQGVQNLLWFAFAVVAWRFVLNPRIKSMAPKNLAVLHWITRVLYCFLIAATVWLFKIFCIKLVASSFHVNTYFDRIRESLFSQYVLETLMTEHPIVDVDNAYKDEESKFMNEVDELKKAGAKLPECMATLPGKQAAATQPKLAPVPTKQSVGGKSGLDLKSDKSSQQQDHENGETAVIAIDHLHRLNQKNISAWHMKRLAKFVRSRGISTMVNGANESISRNIKGDGTQEEEGEIQSEWQARLIARKIFKNVAKPGCRYITVEDVGRFMRLKEVMKAMPLFEGATESGGKITKLSLKNLVVYVFRERRALALSLKDTKTAVKKLHKIINVVASMIIMVIWLLVLGFATKQLLLLVSSQLVLVIFIFGNTVKVLFEAIVFLFIMHPFDVGDRCQVEGNQVVVEEMNILSTLFLKNDGEKVWYPNSVLATKPITNYYRTPDTGDFFNFSIHVSTPILKITLLKEKIQRYLTSKPNHWTSEMYLVVLEIEDMNKMKIQLLVNHTIDYHDILERQIRRSNLILEVKCIFEDVGVEYHLLPQDVQIVPFSTPRA